MKCRVNIRWSNPKIMEFVSPSRDILMSRRNLRILRFGSSTKDFYDASPCFPRVFRFVADNGIYYFRLAFRKINKGVIHINDTYSSLFVSKAS